MRTYNDSPGIGVLKPGVDIGFGIAVGEVFVYLLSVGQKPSSSKQVYSRGYQN
jgi:hypothetical protein